MTDDWSAWIEHGLPRCPKILHVGMVIEVEGVWVLGMFRVVAKVTVEHLEDRQWHNEKSGLLILRYRIKRPSSFKMLLRVADLPSRIAREVEGI